MAFPAKRKQYRDARLKGGAQRASQAPFSEDPEARARRRSFCSIAQGRRGALRRAGAGGARAPHAALDAARHAQRGLLGQALRARGRRRRQELLHVERADGRARLPAVRGHQRQRVRLQQLAVQLPHLRRTVRLAPGPPVSILGWRKSLMARWRRGLKVPAWANGRRLCTGWPRARAGRGGGAGAAGTRRASRCTPGGRSAKSARSVASCLRKVAGTGRSWPSTASGTSRSSGRPT